MFSKKIWINKHNFTIGYDYDIWGVRSIFFTLSNTFLTLSNTEKLCPTLYVMREYIVPNRMNTDHDTEQITLLELRYIFFEEKLENVGTFFI